MASHPKLADLVHRLQASLRRAAARPEELFRQYDQHNSKGITINQFVRCLDLVGVKVTPDEQRELLRQYGEGSEIIRFVPFMEVVNRVFGETQRLEQNPANVTLTASDPLSGTDTVVPGPQVPLSGSDERRLHELLDVMRRAVETERIFVNDFCDDFDRQRKGVITTSQFGRAICRAFPFLQPADTDLLSRAYGRGSPTNPTARMVAYRRLHNDVTDASVVAAGFGNTATTTADMISGNPARTAGASLRLSGSLAAAGGAALSPSATHASRKLAERYAEAEARPGSPEAARAAARAGGPRAALDQVIKSAVLQRVRMRDFFDDYDPLRKGFISVHNFNRSMEVMKLRGVTPEHRTAVAELFFDDGPKMVNYDRLCDEVEQGFGFVRNRETNPVALGETRAMAVAKDGTGPGVSAAEGLSRLSSSERSALEAGLDGIRRVVGFKRIDLVNAFKDFDRAHEEHVTEPRFWRLMTMLGLYPQDAKQRAAIAKRFRGVGSRSKLIYWRGFKNEVDPRPEEARDEAAQAAARREALARTVPPRHASALPRPDDPVDVGAVMLQLKQRCVAEGIRIEEFFRDYDRLRHGHISAAQLQTALTEIGFRPVGAEMQALWDEYGDEAFGRDPQGRLHIDVVRFARDVNLAFGARNLERRPEDAGAARRQEALLGTAHLRTSQRPQRVELTQTTSAATVAAAAAGGGGGHRLTMTEQDALDEIVDAIFAYCSPRNLHMTPTFESYDKHKHGVVGANHFLRCLTQLKLPVTHVQGQLLVKAFGAPGPGGAVDVAYRWFEAAVEHHDSRFILEAVGSTPEGVRLTNAALAATVREAVEAGRMDVRTVAAPGGFIASPTASAAMGAVARKQAGQVLRNPAEGAWGRMNNPPESKSGEEAEEVVEYLRRVAKARGVRLRTFFDDFDRLRKGAVSVPHFRAALGQTGIRLSFQQLTALEKRFQDDRFKDKVRYRDLCALIDGGAEGLERKPGATVRLVEIPGDVGANETARAATATSEFEQTLQHTRGQVRERRINLVPAFQDFDKLRHNTVDRVRFLAILAGENLKLTPAQSRLLADGFHSDKEPGKVNWRRFWNAVDFMPGK